jgi:hypothetical protein
VERDEARKETIPLIFNGPLKFLSILHQGHSKSPFYWNMNSVNTRSFPNYTKRILGYTTYIPKVSEMLWRKLEHINCYTRHNPTARVITVPGPLPHQNLPHGQLSPQTTHPMDNSSHDNSPHSQFAPWKTRPMDNSPEGQLTPWTTHPMDNSPHRNSPHGQLASWSTRPITTRLIASDKKLINYITFYRV